MIPIDVYKRQAIEHIGVHQIGKHQALEVPAHVVHPRVNAQMCIRDSTCTVRDTSGMDADARIH